MEQYTCQLLCLLSMSYIFISLIYQSVSNIMMLCVYSGPIFTMNASLVWKNRLWPYCCPNLGEDQILFPPVSPCKKPLEDESCATKSQWINVFLISKTNTAWPETIWTLQSDLFGKHEIMQRDGRGKK